MTNPYAVTEDDLKGGGGGSHEAKPRGLYTGQIAEAKAKNDSKGKPCIQFRIKITHGKRKGGLLFENWLSLNPEANGFATARRRSFYKAIGLQAGAIPYGAPIEGAPAVELLNGTYVDVQLEHRFEQVPGQDYNIVTSKSSKQRWLEEGWDKCVNEQGQLVKDPFGNVFDAPVDPKEELTFYNISDEFAGVGDPDAVLDEPVADDEPLADWGA